MIGPKELKLAKLSLAMVEQLMPQDDKSTAMQIYSFLVCNGVDWRLPYARVDFEGWPTVNLYGKQINKNVWNGLSYIFTTILWCHLDWWNNCSGAITQAILLPQSRRATLSKAPPKTHSDGSRLGRKQLEWPNRHLDTSGKDECRLLHPDPPECTACSKTMLVDTGSCKTMTQKTPLCSDVLWKQWNQLVEDTTWKSGC